MNIKELETAIKDGDKNKVILLCEPIIYHYLHKLGFWYSYENDREDFVQEGRLAILRCLETYDGRGLFTTYVHSAIRNYLYNYVKKNDLREVYRNIELNTEVIEDVDDLSTKLLYDDVVRDILDDGNEIVMMYFLEQKTQKEIAEDYGCSQQWVSQVLDEFIKKERYKYGN